MNLPYLIKDEIALEGLEGITLNDLWQRIKIRTPNGFVESSKICNQCWDYIKSQKWCEVFILPQPRPPLGDCLVLDSNAPNENRYKFNPVDKNGISGSCGDFDTRKKLPSDQLKKLTYELAVEQYGSKLVVVADQATRFQALVPQNLMVRDQLHPVDFLLLERIGRSRNIGIRTRGENSLGELVSDPRSLFFRREGLRKMKLISYAKDSYSIFVFLPRFRGEVKEHPKEKVIRLILEEAFADPNKQISSPRAAEIFRSIYPPDNASGESWKAYNKRKAIRGNFDLVKIPRWSKTRRENVHDIFYKLKPKFQKIEDAVDDNPEESFTDSKKADVSPEFLNTSGQYYGLSAEKQVLLEIESKGHEGASFNHLIDTLGFSRNPIRNATKFLKKHNFIFEDKRQLKSSTKIHFVAKRFADKTSEEETVLPTPEVESLPRETTQEFPMVDVYGVTTLVTVEPMYEYRKALEADTEKRRRRRNLVLEIIREKQMWVQLNAFNEYVIAKDASGLCRKTIGRILQILIDQGMITVYKVTLKRNEVIKSVEIVVDRQVLNMQSEKFQDALKNLHRKIVPMVNEKFQGLSSRQMHVKLRYSERRFFNFAVLRNLHRFLVHYTWLHVDVEGQEPHQPLGVPPDWKELLNNDEDLPPVYDNSGLGMKTFVAPRKISAKEKDLQGWVGIKELMESLPLRLVYELYKPIDLSPSIPELLRHPVKKFYPMKNIQVFALINNPWFVEVFLVNLRRLCFLGLLRFSGVAGKRKATMQVYINRKRDIYDTTTREYMKELPPLDTMEKISMEFTASDVVEKYWRKLATICEGTQTPRKGILGYRGTIKELAQWIEPIPLEQGPLLDDGSIPGDGRGPAGTHMGMSIHMFVYWDRVRTNPVPRKIIPKTSEEAKLKAAPKKERVYLKTYDDVDEHARGVSGLRSKWSPAEDTALLFGKLANMLICTNRSNMQLVSCVAYRDVLHWMCHSIDKSAKMCSRRVAFLCKNEVTKSTIEISLKEIRSMKSVMDYFPADTLQTLKQMYPIEDEFVSAVKIRFVQLVKVLSGIYSKFTSNSFTKRTPSEMPNTPEELFEKFRVSDEKKETPEWNKGLDAEELIRLHMVYNVVHSSMCCAEDDFSYSLLLLDIYKNYNEELLHRAMDQARDLQLITKWKINYNQSKKTIPLNTRPFHLSNYYTRRLALDYNYDILRRVYQWVDEARKGRDMFTNIDRSFCFFFTGLQFREAIDVDSSVPSTVRRLQLVGAEEDLEPPSSKKSKKEEATRKVSFKDDVSVHDFDYEPTELMLKVNSLNWHLFCYLKESIQAKTTRVPSKKMTIDTDGRCNFSCVIENIREFEEMEDCLSKVNVRDYKAGIHRIMKNLQEEKEKKVAANKKDLGNIKHLKRTNIKYVNLLDDISRDSFDPLINRVCTVRLKDGVVFPREPNKDLIGKRLLRWALIKRPQKTLAELFGPEVAEEVENILNFVKICETAGASAKDVAEAFKEVDDLDGKLLTLVDNHHLLYCGITEIRYVYYDNREPWVVMSYAPDEMLLLKRSTDTSRMQIPKRVDPTKPSSAKRAKIREQDTTHDLVEYGHRTLITLRMFPWIRVTGTLNQRVVDRVMGTILLHLQGRVGLPVKALFSKLSFFHEPHVILLLKAMQNLELIKVYKIEKQKVSLFSSYQSPVVELSRSLFLDDPADLFVEATGDSVLKYCEIRGEYEYTTQYC